MSKTFIRKTPIKNHKTRFTTFSTVSQKHNKNEGFQRFLINPRLFDVIPAGFIAIKGFSCVYGGFGISFIEKVKH